MTPDIGPLVERIRRTRAAVPPSRAALVAISGIDGSGKGFVAERVAAALEAGGLRAAVVAVDGWLNLPDKRFGKEDPGGHFYRHAVRFEEMFGRLVLPLRDGRSCHVEVDFAEETATRYRRHVYDVADCDVVLLEGIFLLKRELRGHYDLSVWIACGFETALRRAVARCQEGLPPERTIEAYRTIYFPAQRLHFERDDPREAAGMILDNDAAA